MVQTAWILTPGAKRRPAGFIRGSDLDDHEVVDVYRERRRRREKL